MKIQQKIALRFALLSIFIVLVVSVMEYYLANQNTFEDFYKRLEIRAIVAAKTTFEEGEMAQSAFEDLRRRHLETLPHEKEYFIPVNDYWKVADEKGLKLDADFYETAIKTGSVRHKDGNVFYLGFLYSEQKNNYIVIISAENDYIVTYLSNLRKVLIITLLATVIISLLIGMWFSKRILKPIRLITEKMQDISANKLHLRLDEDGGTDELSGLAWTFNNMLDRLEATFETQKNFISNASHELNTPLTTIIGESEFVLSKPRSQEQYTESLSVILSEAERLRRITNSLLQLAQTGYTAKAQEFEQLRIDEVVYVAKETVDNIIPDNKVHINLGLMPEDESKLLIKGNQQLLELALVNIITNGCKYSDNQPVQVTMAAALEKVIVIIEDKGIGIPKDEIAYIYEPFFRASNTEKFNGYGIGLPLSRNIIRLHNGTLEVTSEENVGTKIKITIPLNTGAD